MRALAAHGLAARKLRRVVPVRLLAGRAPEPETEDYDDASEASVDSDAAAPKRKAAAGRVEQDGGADAAAAAAEVVTDAVVSRAPRPVRRLLLGLGNPGDKFARTRHNVGFMVVQHFVDHTLPQLLWRQSQAIASGDPGASAGSAAGPGLEATARAGTVVSPTLQPIGSGEALHCAADLAFAQSVPPDECIRGAPAHADDLVDQQSARRKAKTREEGVLFPSVAVHCLLPYTFMNRSGSPLRKFMDRGHWRMRRNPQSAARGDDLIVIYDDIALPFGTLAVRHKGGDGSHNGIADVMRRLGTERVTRLRVGVGNPHTPSPTGHKATHEYVLGRFAAHEAEQLPALCAMACEVLRVYLHRGVDAAATMANGLHLDDWKKQSRWSEWAVKGARGGSANA